MDENATSGYIVEYGYAGFTPGSGSTVYVTGDTCLLTGLSPLTTYDIYVYYDCNNDGIVTNEVPTLVSYMVPDLNLCIDYSDLTSPWVTCTYGYVTNPMANVGVVSGHHTVMTSGYSPRTNYQLLCVPPGALNSVRLGDECYGGDCYGGAETITYDFLVDTTQFGIFLMKYAAVMGRDDGGQPKFVFKLLDENGAEVDPQCTSAEFISHSDNTNGWQAEGYDVLWKDWTTIGIDVSSYHGRNLKIFLATYDCYANAPMHFACAYFTLGCSKKEIIVETCGEMLTSTYTAPAGFNYRWYYSNDPNTTLATSQTATIPITDNAETLCCYCSYLENPNCGFEITSSLESRYPLAQFSISRDSCTHSFTFHNESTISFDAQTPSGTGEPCQGYYWDFGDGATSIEESPSHEYQTAGTYVVTLIATLNNDQCQDTIRDTVAVLRNEPVISGVFEICRGDSTVLFASGGLNNYEWLQDTVSLSTGSSIVVAPADTTTYILRSYEPDGCYVDTMQEIIVHIPNIIEIADSICVHERYEGYGFSFGTQDNPGSVHSEMMYQNQYGCDSLVKLSLFVKQLPTIYMESMLKHCFLFDGLLELAVSGDGCDSYLWNTGEVTNTINIAEAGVYTVSAILNGCSNSAQTTVEELCILNPVLPNVMTPNGDNVNDVFIIKNMDPDVPNKLTIYNRWGKKVYEKENYQTYCWEGDSTIHNATEGFTAEGLSDGVFFYTFHYEDSVKTVDYHGTITVIR